MCISERNVLLSKLAHEITGIRLDRPIRVGIDGLSAAGKTTLADELAPRVALCRPCVRASIDDFHLPGHKYRSIRGDFTPSSSYTDSYDYETFARVLLEPLAAARPHRIRLGVFDSYHDKPMVEEWTLVDDETVLLVDGSFLAHPALAPYWDFLVYLEIDPETAVRRARSRDVVWVGDPDEVERRYRTRHIPGHYFYESETGVRGLANVIIDNNDLARPVVLRGDT